MNKPFTPSSASNTGPSSTGPGGDTGPDKSERAGRRATIDIVNASLGRRYRAERRFRFIGMSAVVLLSLIHI